MASSNKVDIEIAAHSTAGPVINGVADDMAAIGPAAGKAQGASDGALDSMHKRGLKASEAAKSISDQLALIQRAYVGLQATQGMQAIAADLAKTADAYNNLGARIKLVTGEGAGFTQAFEGVSAVAQRTSSNLESTGNLFTKLAEAGKSAGLGTKDAIDQALALTETVNQAVQLSGASAGASDAAITQLIQGLQGGVLRGDEFNSVMEQSPRLAKALADGLGTTTGELRKMAEAGQLSSEVVIKALKGQADTVASEFSKLPPTVGRALENLSTSWTLYVGETDRATGASKAAATVISALANNLSTIAGYLIDAGQAATAFAALKLAQHFTGIATAAAGSATAVAANASAIAAAGAAGTTAATGVGRFASVLGGLKTFSLIGLVTNFHDIGTAIGEGAARLMGYKDRTLELAAADKAATQIAADNIEMRRRQAAALVDATNANWGLSKAATASIAEFDKLTKEGTSAAEAIKKIGKDFDLSSVPGIKNAAAVLAKLAADGKLSATEFQAAWADALKGQDLAAFEAKFRVAMLQTQADADKAAGAWAAAIARGVSGKELDKFAEAARLAMAAASKSAEQLAQVLDASLRESIRRTGLDFDVISGGMSKASISAINDTDTMIKGLDRLKAMGVDTGQALSASLGKGINTADSQKALDAVRLQIEAVRKVLGDKVADGLLDQAKTKATELGDALDKAKPGINSLREAMKELGVTSDQTFKDTAAKSAAAYQAMKESGTASVRELSDGFKKYATDAIAANNGVATEALKAEAGMRGLEIATDSAGRSIVQAMGGGKKSTDEFASSVKAATSAMERQNTELERTIAAQEKANQLKDRANQLERERLSIDKEGFSTGKDGQRIAAGGDLTTLTGVAAFLKNAGVADEAKARELAREFADGQGNITYMNNPGQKKYGGDTISMALLKAAETYTFGTGNTGTGKQPSTIPKQSTTHTVNVNINGQNTPVNVASETDAQALIAALKRAQQAAG